MIIMHTSYKILTHNNKSIEPYSLIYKGFSEYLCHIDTPYLFNKNVTKKYLKKLFIRSNKYKNMWGYKEIVLENLKKCKLKTVTLTYDK